jgi:hypothetical protein
VQGGQYSKTIGEGTVDKLIVPCTLNHDNVSVAQICARPRSSLFTINHRPSSFLYTSLHCTTPYIIIRPWHTQVISTAYGPVRLIPRSPIPCFRMLLRLWVNTVNEVVLLRWRFAIVEGHVASGSIVQASSTCNCQRPDVSISVRLVIKRPFYH